MKEEILILGRDIVIREQALPFDHVHGFCLIDEDGIPNVYLNENDPEERQLKALKHEVLHAIRNDHYRNQDIAEAEVDETLDHYEILRGADRLILRQVN